MDFQAINDPETSTVRCIGELDIGTSPALLAAVDGNGTNGRQRRLTLDLSELTFIDSAGTRALVELKRRHGHVMLLSPTPQVRRIFDLLRFEDIVGIEISRTNGDPP